MKITVINTGVTKEAYLKKGIEEFEKRILHYLPLEMIYLKEPKNAKGRSEVLVKQAEGLLIKQAMYKIDYPVLLDVEGKPYTSQDFSAFIQQKMNRGVKNLGFIIGGSYGFSDEVYQMATERISISQMTFSHQMIRLIFLEQLYRAFTIINGEPYHHA